MLSILKPYLYINNKYVLDNSNTYLFTLSQFKKARPYIYSNDKWYTTYINAGDKPSSTYSTAYNGQEQNNNYTTPIGVNVTGAASGTNAGTYTATYTPQDEYCWSDETQDSVDRIMTIEKANGSITLSSTTGTIVSGSSTLSFTATGTGTLSVSSNNTSIATCSIDGNTITCTRVLKSASSCIITVTAAESDNYTATSTTFTLSLEAAYKVSDIKKLTFKRGDFLVYTCTASSMEIIDGVTWNNVSNYVSCESSSSNITITANKGYYALYLYLWPYIILNDGSSICLGNTLYSQDVLAVMQNNFADFSNISLGISGSINVGGGAGYYITGVIANTTHHTPDQEHTFSDSISADKSSGTTSAGATQLYAGSMSGSAYGIASLSLGALTINGTSFTAEIDLT